MKPEYTLRDLMSYSGLILAENVGYLMEFYNNIDTKLSKNEILEKALNHIKSIDKPYLWTFDACIETINKLGIPNILRKDITFQKLKDVFYEINLLIANNVDLRTHKIKSRDLSKYKKVYIPYTRKECDDFVIDKYYTNLYWGAYYENKAIEFLQNNLPNYSFRKANKFEDTHGCVDIVALKNGNNEFGIQVKSYSSILNNNHWDINNKLQNVLNYPIYYLYYHKGNFVKRNNGKYLVKNSEVNDIKNLSSLFN